MEKEDHPWLKSKGYTHVTPQIDVGKRFLEIYRKVTNPKYVAKYAFYPLIHSTITERRYKKIGLTQKDRAHSYKADNGKYQQNKKSRPLHYASHMDAIIFGYYADILQNKYEERIQKFPQLHDCIIAYRKMPISEQESNKSTIHFANEVFQEIKRRFFKNSDCCVLTFDIKSFFSSLDHKILKKAWADLFDLNLLPDDHYNVFKAATKFSYFLFNDLKKNYNKDKRFGFDEAKLAQIRNQKGIHCFFESAYEFRSMIKNGDITLHKYPFRNKQKEPIGIPQGLPISAILANLYLLSFDLKILDFVVSKYNGYYRRYSDDIVIVCSPNDADNIKEFVEGAILESKVQISKEKTEKFLFKNCVFGKKSARLTCIKVLKDKQEFPCPLVYLGFEFNGKNILIKSANLAKFYRRMISSVKRKANRAFKISSTFPETNPVLFRRQLYKLYTTTPVNKTKVHSRWKKLIKNEYGTYKMVTGEKVKFLRSNYLTYVTRASEIMGEPAIKNQIRNHKKIFNDAVHKHLKRIPK